LIYPTRANSACEKDTGAARSRMERSERKPLVPFMKIGTYAALIGDAREASTASALSMIRVA